MAQTIRITLSQAEARQLLAATGATTAADAVGTAVRRAIKNGERPRPDLDKSVEDFKKGRYTTHRTAREAINYLHGLVAAARRKKAA